MRYIIIILIVLFPFWGFSQDKIPVKQLGISAGQGIILNSGNGKILIDDNFFGTAAFLSEGDILGDIVDGDGINANEGVISVSLSTDPSNGLSFKQGDLYMSSTGSASSLQDVTDIGSTTTNSITAAHFYRSSDIRLKRVVDRKNYENPLYIPMITYYWKDKVRGGKIQYGYSAQAVQSVYPELVSTDDNGHLSLDYTELHTLQIEKLKKEVKVLKEEIENLKMMLK